MTKKIIVANWKMNPETLADAKKLLTGIRKALGGIRSSAAVIICPPYVFLSELKKNLSGRRIALGVQDVFWEAAGAYTGEVAAGQAKSAGAQYAIVGHSERRALGETDEMVNKKVRAAIAGGLSPIVCVGERERDPQGQYLSFLRDQVESAFAGVSKRELAKAIVAYEPVWAIGKSAQEAMQPHDMHEMVLYIRKVLTGRYDKKTAGSIPVLYGGSVEPSNANDLLTLGQADGFLVGRASLSAHAFSTIISTTSVNGR